MKYLGIDPGEAWIGLALLSETPTKNLRRAVGKSATLDVRDASTVEAAQRLIPYITGCDWVVVEDFSMRPVGPNAFDKGRTLRLLGMIEWLCNERGIPVSFVPPGKPERALQLWPSVCTGFFKFTGDAQHATSAWRVLGAYLIDHDVQLLRTFEGNTR